MACLKIPRNLITFRRLMAGLWASCTKAVYSHPPPPPKKKKVPGFHFSSHIAGKMNRARSIQQYVYTAFNFRLAKNNCHGNFVVAFSWTKGRGRCKGCFISDRGLGILDITNMEMSFWKAWKLGWAIRKAIDRALLWGQLPAAVTHHRCGWGHIDYTLLWWLSSKMSCHAILRYYAWSY